MKIQPLGDRVLVEPAKEDEIVKGGIIIPDTAKEKPQQGKVIAIGNATTDEKGNNFSFSVKKGDLVLMKKYRGDEFKLDGKEYVLVKEKDLLGILVK